MLAYVLWFDTYYYRLLIRKQYLQTVWLLSHNLRYCFNRSLICSRDRKISTKWYVSLHDYIWAGKALMSMHQMYEETMDAVNKHLVQKSTTSNLIYTAELIPERHPGGEV